MKLWKIFDYYSNNIMKDICFNIYEIDNNDIRIYACIPGFKLSYVYSIIVNIKFKYYDKQSFRCLFQSIISILEERYILYKENGEIKCY